MASTQDRGYNKQLLVLPFDHRGSFQEKLFGIKGQPTAAETKEIASFKTIIYEGFEKAVRSGLPKEIMGILVDEQFGTEVIQRAKQQDSPFRFQQKKVVKMSLISNILNTKSILKKPIQT